MDTPADTKAEHDPPNEHNAHTRRQEQPPRFLPTGEGRLQSLLSRSHPSVRGIVVIEAVDLSA